MLMLCILCNGTQDIDTIKAVLEVDTVYKAYIIAVCNYQYIIKAVQDASGVFLNWCQALTNSVKKKKTLCCTTPECTFSSPLRSVKVVVNLQGNGKMGQYPSHTGTL